MRSKSLKTLSAILIVLVLLTLSCEFSFDLGGNKDSTATLEIQQVTSAPVEQIVTPTEKPTETAIPPTNIPPTEVPPTQIPPTSVPPTAVPTQPPAPTDEPVAESEPYYTE